MRAYQHSLSPTDISSCSRPGPKLWRRGAQEPNGAWGGALTYLRGKKRGHVFPGSPVARREGAVPARERAKFLRGKGGEPEAPAQLQGRWRLSRGHSGEGRRREEGPASWAGGGAASAEARPRGEPASVRCRPGCGAQRPRDLSAAELRPGGSPCGGGRDARAPLLLLLHGRRATGTSSMSSGYSSWEESESEEFFFTARTSFFRSCPAKAKPSLQDVQKEREAHTYLTKEAIKEKVQTYNSDVTDKLKMTLHSSGVYTGFIKVQMELCRPITVRAPASPGKHVNNNSETAFCLPNGYTNTLHISSTNTVREVIEALLKKFMVADNPAKFALYKRCHKEDQVYTCKLSEIEHPLYLRLVAGPRTDMLSFVLREHETGEFLWEAFSVPELQNFLRILDKEEDEQLQILQRRYAAYRDKLEEALGGVWKPG
ncbi:ras association domain-containing protein 3 isoform X1 [Podarcis muralis]